MTYEEWKAAHGIDLMIDRQAPYDPAKAAWNAALDEAAKIALESEGFHAKAMASAMRALKNQ